MMRAIYDLQYWQPTYTITILLVLAEQERIRRGEDAVQIEIVPGTVNGFGPYKHWPNTQEDCIRGLNGIVKPMSTMLPSIADVVLLSERTEPGDAFSIGTGYSSGPYFRAYASGLRPLRALETKQRDPNLFTITLRECGPRHLHMRDSNVAEWCNAARVLVKRGYRVIFVRDTRVADVPLGPFECSPLASRYLHARASLYRSAACNMFVSNGPAWFALALDVPLLMFRPACDGANKNSSVASMAKAGVREGKQMDGAPDHQRLVWADDKADIIVQQCLEFLGSTRSA